MNRPSTRGSPNTNAAAVASSQVATPTGKAMDDWENLVQSRLDNSPSSSPASLKLFKLGYGSSPPHRKGHVLPLGTTMLLCFVCVFVIISTFGPRHHTYNLDLVPRLDVYRAHRRLQAEVVVDPLRNSIFGSGNGRMRELPPCEDAMWDYVPCYDNSIANDSNSGVSVLYTERHCDKYKNNKQCIVKPPEDYRVPLGWPASKDGVWRGNLRFGDEFSLTGKRMTSLKQKDGGLVSLDKEDRSSNRIEKQIQRIMKTVDIDVHTILDLNCGLSRLSTLPMKFEKSSLLCLAPYEPFGSQVHFSLERGLSALIGSPAHKQLPFPSQSFDMIHCFDCNFDLTSKDGLVLLELHRLLKPGGYFVWSSQLEKSADKLKKQVEESHNELAAKVCWTVVSELGAATAWKKSSNHSCYSSRTSKTKLKLCGKSVESSSAGYAPLRSCLTEPSEEKNHQLQQWQKRRGPLSGFSSKELSDDSRVWSAMVQSYWSLFTPLIFSDHPKRQGDEEPVPPSNMNVRNVMDMNALYGNWGAAVLDNGKPVWVINVVPRSGPDTLSTIYKRGMIGVSHDWCEAFPTYPRTYDLLHGIGLLSQESSRPNGCGLSTLFLEMDRILRPEGWVILRDKSELIENVRIAASQLKWDSRVIDIEGHHGDQQLLVCQKPALKNQPVKAVQ